MKWILFVFLGLLPCVPFASAAELYTVDDVEAQPLMAQALRISEALSFLGSALQPSDRAKLEALVHEAPGPEVVAQVQEILDPYCLVQVHINPEMRVKVHRGPAEAQLMQHGWTSYLVKVHNESGTRGELHVESPNAAPRLMGSSGAPEPKEENLLSEGQVANRFLEIAMYQERPLQAELSGLPLEYAVVQFYSTDAGAREAGLGFNVGQGTQDLGFRNEVPILFQSTPSVRVKLRVRDDDGEPAMASFIFMDQVERIVPKDYRLKKASSVPTGTIETMGRSLVGVYPLPSRRVAAVDKYPDFYFQPQVYRADGEDIDLPPGKFDVIYTRGPEYIPQLQELLVPGDVDELEATFQLKRWIHVAAMGWYSADHHVHGGGCSHYESPTAGVDPESMFRQSLGEDLNVSCVLSWGPCWYFQKSYFEGDVNRLSTADNLIRYDVEVSGFPSSHAGHVALLRLKEDDYPGTEKIEEWPSWTLPVMQWAQSQGGAAGYAHSGWGLEPLEKTDDLPNYVMAKFDGIGANEYIVTGVHGAADFISAGDTPVAWELNIWYHTLNCGLTARISGETDFPCIYDERVGIARSYAPLDGELIFDKYVDKIKQGANYVSDGRSHLLNFQVDDVVMGENGSILRLDGPRPVEVKARVAAYLPDKNDESALDVAAQWTSSPYWHLEKARLGESRQVPVELIVNGYPVARQEITADGEVRGITFTHPIDQSSWVALRILPSSHTNPVFIEVAGKPIRASRRSAEWCRAAVDRCWEMKEPRIREEEKAAAIAAYDVARAYYDKAIAEAVVE